MIRPLQSVALVGCALLFAGPLNAQQVMSSGDVAKGRLLFATCRTCHYAEPAMGHNNGPNLHRIFGKVVGEQADFEYYSDTFKAAQFVWTPEFMFVWLENPMAMFPDSTMMSRGVPDPQQRVDLIAFLKQASVRDPQVND
jgi:cytochrome c